MKEDIYGRNHEDVPQFGKVDLVPGIEEVVQEENNRFMYTQSLIKEEVRGRMKISIHQILCTSRNRLAQTHHHIITY